MHSMWNFGGRGGRHGGRFGGRGGGGFMGRFGGGFGGAGFRAARMLASGDLQLIVLALLKEKPRYGYEIIKALEDHSSGAYVPSPGVVYPALTYLEEMGYATVETDGNKKLYQMTDTGTKYLEENREIVDETLEQLAAFGKKMEKMRRHFVDEERDEEFGGHDPRRQAREEWHRMRTEFRDLRDQLKAALREKFDASVEEKERVLGILRKAIDEIRKK